MTVTERDRRHVSAPPPRTANRRPDHTAHRGGRPGGGRPAPGTVAAALIGDLAAAVLLGGAGWATAPAGGPGLSLAALVALTALAGAIVASGRIAVAGRLARPAPGAPAEAAAGLLLVAASLATVLLPLLRAGAHTRAAAGPALVLAGAALGTAATVTWLSVLLVPSLARGGRPAVLPALLAGSGGGVLAVLFAPVVVEVLDTSGRVGPSAALLTYSTAAAASLGLAQILAVHRLVRVGGRGVALVGLAALAVGAAEVLLSASPTLDDGIVGLVGAAAVLLVGLGSATLAGGPDVRHVPGRDERLPLGETEGAGAGLAADVRPAETVEPVAVAVVGVATVVGVIARLLVGPTGGAADAATAQLVNGSLHDALQGAVGAAHPPLGVALTWCARALVGSSPLALRLPSLLAGGLLIPVAFAAGRALYGRRTGLVAAGVAAVGPAFVWVSGAAGPAALTALLVCLVILALAAALRSGGLVAWVLFGVAAAAVVWAHQFGVVTVVVLHVAAGVEVIRRFRAGRPAGAARRADVARLVGWSTALALTVTAVVGLVAWRHGFGAASTPATLEYAANAAPGGGHTPFGLAAGALSAIVGFHPPDVTSRLLALWPLGILATFALFGRRWSPRGTLLVGLAAGPFVALLIADVVGAPRQPPLALEWLAPALPAVALAAGRAVDRLSARQRHIGLVVTALVAVLTLGTVDQTVRVAARAPASPAAASGSGLSAKPNPPSSPSVARPPGDATGR